MAPTTASRFAAIAAVVLTLLVGACSTTARRPAMTAEEFSQATEDLRRPLEGGVGLLYRLRTAGTGRLGLTVLVDDHGEGRMTVADTFGATVAVAAWTRGDQPVLYDLREECAVRGRGVAGFATLPMDRAILLMTGALPLRDGDELRLEDGAAVISSSSWSARVEIATAPWRITRVEAGDLVIRLSDHDGIVPGRIVVKGADESAELELRRLERNRIRRLPDVPDLPWCGAP